MSSFRVEAEFGDASVAAAVLGRVVSILGSRVTLPIDRLSDALLVSDAVIAATHGASPVLVEADLEPKRLALSIGPLERGVAGHLVDVIEGPLGKGSLARLVDELHTSVEGSAEFLVLALSPA